MSCDLWKSWQFNAVEPAEDEESWGRPWCIGHRNEDRQFAPVVWVDAGLYGAPEDTEPLARAILALIEAAAARAVLALVPAGEPVAWACWCDGQDPDTARPLLVDYEPLAHPLRRALVYAAPVAAVPDPVSLLRSLGPKAWETSPEAHAQARLIETFAEAMQQPVAAVPAGSITSVRLAEPIQCDKDTTVTVTLSRFDLRDRLAAGRAAADDGWVRCADHMPPEDDIYQVSNGKEVDVCQFIKAQSYPDQCQWAQEDFVMIDVRSITHWKPLSAPPGDANG